MLIDSHCHPDDERFAGEQLGLLQRAAAAGVGGLVAIDGLGVAAEYGGTAGLPRIWATVGVHPHEAAKATAETLAGLERAAGDGRVIAIGEIGLDYYYDHSPRETQRAVFRRQLELAAEAGLPVSIHCRDAFEDCLAELEAPPPPAGVVFHCFTGSQAWAARILQQQWYVSFSGVLTFPKSESLREVAREAAADRILVETDAPYLAPVPHRGKRNEPAFVAETAAVLGRLRGWTPAETAAQTAANFFRLFPRARAGAES